MAGKKRRKKTAPPKTETSCPLSPRVTDLEWGCQISRLKGLCLELIKAVLSVTGGQKGFSHLQDLSVSDRIVLTLQMALPFQKRTEVKVGAPEQQPVEIRADVRMNKTGCSKGFRWISHGTGFIDKDFPFGHQ